MNRRPRSFGICGSKGNLSGRADQEVEHDVRMDQPGAVFVDPDRRHAIGLDQEGESCEVLHELPTAGIGAMQ